MNAQHLTAEQIEAGLPDVLASPREEGTVEALVIRPAVDKRERLESVRLSPEGGLEGDRWITSSAKRLPDGRPDPCDQVSLMNSRLLRLIALEEDRLPLAGDNLVVDLDLSAANLPVGQKLRAGQVLLEITDWPHTGCDKFASRFGLDAARFVNARERKDLHLRGRYARVLQAGTVQVGDAIVKID